MSWRLPNYVAYAPIIALFYYIENKNMKYIVIIHSLNINVSIFVEEDAYIGIRTAKQELHTQPQT